MIEKKITYEVWETGAFIALMELSSADVTKMTNAGFYKLVAVKVAA